MRLRTIYFLTAIFCCGSAAVAQSDWQEYRYSDDHFAISAPQAPKFVDRSPGYGRLSHVYGVDLGGDRGIAVTVTEVPRNVASSEMLHEACVGGAERIRATLTGERGAMVSGIGGWTCFYKTAKVQFRSDMTVRDHRLYMITAVAPLSDTAFPPETERFIKSFHFAD